MSSQEKKAARGDAAMDELKGSPCKKRTSAHEALLGNRCETKIPLFQYLQQKVDPKGAFWLQSAAGATAATPPNGRVRPQR